MKKNPPAIRRIEPLLVLVVLFCILCGAWLIILEYPLIPLVYNTVREKFTRRTTPVENFQLEAPSSPIIDENFVYYLPRFILKENLTAEDVIQQDHFEKEFQGIDFTENAEPVTLKLSPGSGFIKGDQGIEVSFSPGENCNFGEGDACSYVFPSSLGTKVVFESVHSGLGGEADALRDLFEGTGINKGLYSLSDVQKNINSLAGSRISLIQGDHEVNGISLLTIVRIPPAKVAEYRSLPVEETLAFALDENGLDQGLFENDLLILETCGWRLPDDEYIKGLGNMTYSVYLVLMGMATN